MHLMLLTLSIYLSFNISMTEVIPRYLGESFFMPKTRGISLSVQRVPIPTGEQPSISLICFLYLSFPISLIE